VVTPVRLGAGQLVHVQPEDRWTKYDKGLVVAVPEALDFILLQTVKGAETAQSI